MYRDFLKKLPRGERKRYKKWIKTHQADFELITGQTKIHKHEYDILRRELDRQGYPELIKLMDQLPKPLPHKRPYKGIHRILYDPEALLRIRQLKDELVLLGSDKSKRARNREVAIVNEIDQIFEKYR